MEKKKEELRTEKESFAEDGMRGRSRRNAAPHGDHGHNFRLIGAAAAVIILTAGAGCGYYVAQAGTYNEAFLPNTKINGINVSKKTADEVKMMIEDGLSGYELTVLERTGAGETIKKDEIGLHAEFDGSLEEIIEAQEPMKWVKALWTPAEYEIETMIVYDEAMLLERIRELSCMDPEQMEEPQNAYISEYQSATKSYEIMAPCEGTELVEESVIAAMDRAVMGLQTEVDLDAEACYTKPSVYADDPELVNLAAELNTYVGAVVNHTFGDAKEVLDGDAIHKWLTIDGSEVTLDESQASRYVRALAKKYNTAYNSKKLKSSYGVTVTVPAGPYGWRMNETAEAAAVLEAVKAGNQVTREPEWLQKGASHGEYDYGDTYVEVNLTAQHLFFYKDGKLIVESDFVSGKSSKGWDTPAGAYPLTYKQRNATLRGEDYETPVSYWMPFNGNIGLHDADWRATFGGTLYKTSGSHGCVNLPPKAAKLIYENISAGDPVLCYHLEGTESKTTSKASDVKVGGEASVTETTAAKPAETMAAATAPETTAPTTAPMTETTAPTTEPETETTAPTTTPETETAAPTTAPTTEVPSQAGPGVQPETSAEASETTAAQTGPGTTQSPSTTGTSVQPESTATPAVTPETKAPDNQAGMENEAAGPGYAGNQNYGPGY